MAPNLPADLAIMALNVEEPGILADLIASVLNLALEDKQAILETLESLPEYCARHALPHGIAHDLNSEVVASLDPLRIFGG